MVVRRGATQLSVRDVTAVRPRVTRPPLAQDFGLTIDIEELIDNVDKDGSGEIEYLEFRELLTKRTEGAA
jgi:hypothetical protein